MTTEDTIESTETAETAEAVEAQPRKLLLGKRVLRHFNVKSSVQAGSSPTEGVTTGSARTLRCYGPTVG